MSRYFLVACGTTLNVPFSCLSNRRKVRPSETPDGQRDGFVYEEQSISTSGFRLVHVLLLEK